MSLFGSLMGDFDDDIFGNHMNAMNMQMRSMNRLMNTFMPDPFNMMAPFDPGFQQNALMERQVGPPAMGFGFGFPAMPNMNRLLSADIGNNGGASFSSSSVITMSSGPDGRPQIYQATSSTKTGPGGIRETRRTVQDSVNGVKKMAIGHHIGERAHIIEKEQDLRSGQLEEHQEFINLEEDDAEDFDREFTTKASSGRVGAGGGRLAIQGVPQQQALTIEPLDDDDDDDDEVIETTTTAAGGGHHPHGQHHRPSSSGGSHQRRYMPALPVPPTQPPPSHQNSSTSATKFVSSSSPSPSALPSTTTAAHATAINYSRPSSSSPSLSPSVYATTSQTLSNPNAAAAAPTAAATYTTNSYVPPAARRSSAYHHRSGHHNMGGVSPRRPLRTPPSSPLATTPTMHNHSTATSPSVHPHPYNSSAARRSHHHRSKHAAASKHSAATSATTPPHNATGTTANSSKPKEQESSNQQQD